MQLSGKKIVFQPLFEDCYCVTVDFGSLKGFCTVGCLVQCFFGFFFY